MEVVISKNANFLEISKTILSLALPMAGSSLINVASGFLCMTMLAQLGPQVLAASALIYTTELSIVVTGISILFSLSVLIGHAYGEKNYLAIGNYLQLGWTFGILICIPIILIFLHIKKILILLGQSPDMAEIVQVYFRAFSWSVIPEFLACCNLQFCYGLHKKLLIVSASIMSVIVLMTTAYVLIFGKFGFPELGVAGLGYARAAQNCFFFLFTLLFFYHEKSFARFELFRYRVHHHLELFKQLLRVGWPISVQMGGEMLSFFVSGLMVGWLGTTALAATQVVNQYYFLVIIFIFSLSQASGILVGFACGAKQFHEVKKLGYISMVWVLIVTLLVGAVLVFAPNSLASLYINVHDPKNAELIHLIGIIFLICSLMLIFDGLRHVLIGLLRGLFDTRFPMVMGLLSMWLIGMSLSYILAFTLHIGVIGIPIGGMFGMLVGALVMLYRWRRLTIKYKSSMASGS